MKKLGNQIRGEHFYLTNFPIFAQTGSVYISLEAAGKRIITLDQGRYAESESNIPFTQLYLVVNR